MNKEEAHPLPNVNEPGLRARLREYKTGFNLPYHWNIRKLMENERLEVLSVLLEVSSEYTYPPSLIFRPKKEKREVTATIGYTTIKRLIDIFGSITGLLLTLPISIILAVVIKMSSKGSVFYTQERIGKQGRPFYIYKFRSMVEHAETNGPQLALFCDKRITVIGKFMRRFKLDEIPNFVNVLKGDMALVGYRPERLCFIKQMNRYTTKYHQLLQIKPGITSFGQVNFGYAATLEEMVQRLKLDLDYLKRISFKTDVHILLKTCMVIAKGDRSIR